MRDTRLRRAASSNSASSRCVAVVEGRRVVFRDDIAQLRARAQFVLLRALLRARRAAQPQHCAHTLSADRSREDEGALLTRAARTLSSEDDAPLTAVACASYGGVKHSPDDLDSLTGGLGDCWKEPAHDDTARAHCAMLLTL